MCIKQEFRVQVSLQDFFIFILQAKSLYFKLFKNRILRRIFGSNEDDNREWKRLHSEEHHSSYRSPNIVRVIKSRRLGWAGHAARMEEGKVLKKF